MNHLRPPALVIALLLVLCFADAAPKNRYSVSSSEQGDEVPERESWMFPGFSTHPFLSLVGTRPQRAVTATNSHHLEKRKCNTATCVTQRLADFLTRSSNTIGTVYAPTNVGSSTYGKRELQSPNYLYL
ncbi:calcitonin gene-related peptide 1 [Clupea harengus]|uniref:Calcitonin gene-related peptide 1 n=1 Tax=Clupea harengus TaxID=7950 RepID=A0A6P3VMG9_CLUHA|nr:calcitonin gene-related peptide 1 [Clupea harengus]